MQQHYTVKQIEWDSPEGNTARRIRIAVFVDEQSVPAEMELDEMDPGATHVLAFHGNDACGTGRLFTEPEDAATAHIGRMAVLTGARATGCGTSILQALIARARAQGYRRIILSAQSHALGFYSRHGFEAYGEEYLDAEIPHRAMQMQL